VRQTVLTAKDNLSGIHMFEPQSNSQASFTKVFAAGEDDIVDSLLSILKVDRWENLKLQYEGGSMSAERTELRTDTFEDVKEEVPVTFALTASWFESDAETEIMVAIVESEYEWSQDECSTICDSILSGLLTSHKYVNPDGAASIEGSIEDVDSVEEPFENELDQSIEDSVD